MMIGVRAGREGEGARVVAGDRQIKMGIFIVPSLGERRIHCVAGEGETRGDRSRVGLGL